MQIEVEEQNLTLFPFGSFPTAAQELHKLLIN